MFERELHAETRSSLYQPFDESGVPQGGYDSVDRLRKALRGELSDDGGYTATGGGSITTPISLPNTDTSRDYDLDGLGNWKQSDYIPVSGTATVDLRQHNKLNEITSRKVGDDIKVLFAYDGTTGASNGNLVDDGTLQLSYDAFNRLILVKRKSDGATIGQYVYDASNRRIHKTISNGGIDRDVPNGTTDYLYQNWQIVEERSGSTVNKQYIWGSYIDECIQLKTLTTAGPQSSPAGDYYPLQDLLYRTTALTDDEGEIVEAYDYDAYGNTLIFSEAGTEDNWWADDATQANYGACDVLYCGYRYDPESKQYQVRNREYSPTLGRWLQRDPIGFKGGDWNLYGYIKNNPINNYDPSGLIAAALAAPIAGAVVGCVGSAASSLIVNWLTPSHQSNCQIGCKAVVNCLVGALIGAIGGYAATLTINPVFAGCLLGASSSLVSSYVDSFCDNTWCGCSPPTYQSNICTLSSTIIGSILGCATGWGEIENSLEEAAVGGVMGVIGGALGASCAGI